MLKSLINSLFTIFLLIDASVAIADPFKLDFFEKETLVAKYTEVIETPPSKITTGSVLWLKSKPGLSTTDQISARIFTLRADQDRPSFIKKYSDRVCKAYLSSVVQLSRDNQDSTKLKVAAINGHWLFQSNAQDRVYGKYLIILEKSNNRQSIIRLKTEEDGTNKKYFSSGFIINVEPDENINMKIIEEIQSNRPSISNLIALPENSNPPCYKPTYIADIDMNENYDFIKLTECEANVKSDYQVN